MFRRKNEERREGTNYDINVWELHLVDVIGVVVTFCLLKHR